MKLTILYDNYCPNCTRFSSFVKKMDWLHRITIKPLRDPKQFNSIKGGDPVLAKKQMAGFDGQWHYGYATLYRIFCGLPLFWIFLPVLWLLKISGSGQCLYLQLAVKRQIIPIQCNEESCNI